MPWVLRVTKFGFNSIVSQFADLVPLLRTVVAALCAACSIPGSQQLLYSSSVSSRVSDLETRVFASMMLHGPHKS